MVRQATHAACGVRLMTILGFHIIAPDQAILWSDTETYVGDALFENRNKISVNATMNAVAIGNGLVDVLSVAARHFMGAVSFDETCSRVPRLLRDSERKFHPNATEPQCTFAAVGFSKRFGRLIGCVFSGGYYVGRMTNSWCAPDLGELASLHPESLDDILGLAHQQMADIKRSYSTSKGGPLIGATITRQGIQTRRLMDMTPKLPHPIHEAVAPCVTTITKSTAA